MEMKVLFCHLESKSKEEGRRKKEEGRRKKEEYPTTAFTLSGAVP
jgi:hypothetical protein